MSDTKAKINLLEGTVELEGSEEFVRSYLDEFKKLFNPSQVLQGHHEGAKETVPPHKKSVPKKKAVTKRSASKKTPQKISIERFDIHGNDDCLSLSDFIEEKKPGTANGNIIAVVGYYLTEIIGNDAFSEGQIEYAYKMLKIKRPAHLHQIMINEKNKRDLFEPDSEDNMLWHLTRSGEIFVSDTLPEKSK